MKRRDFLKAVPVAAVAAALGCAKPEEPKRTILDLPPVRPQETQFATAPFNADTIERIAQEHGATRVHTHEDLAGRVIVSVAPDKVVTDVFWALSEVRPAAVDLKVMPFERIAQEHGDADGGFLVSKDADRALSKALVEKDVIRLAAELGKGYDPTWLVGRGNLDVIRRFKS